MNARRFLGFPVVLAAAALAAPGFAAAPAVADAGAVVTVQGEASATLVNDEAVLKFSLEEEESEAAEASRRVSEKVNGVLGALKKLKGVDVKTTEFSTRPLYTKATGLTTAKIRAWRVREALEARVRDTGRVPEVLAAVGSAMNLSGVSFKVSREALTRARTELLGEAVRDASDRAGAVARALDLPSGSVRVESIGVGNSNAPAVRYYAASSAETAALKNAADSVPDMSAGTSDVTLRVSMQVRLLPRTAKAK